MPLRNLGAAELIIILVLAVLIFGPGRIGQIGSELGRGIRGFKEGLGEGETGRAPAQEED
jgi:sec-independent protein translocase protein TatA